MLWMKRFVYTFVGLLLLAIVGVFVLRWWVIGTESGSAFAVRQAEGALGGALSVNSQRGSLGDGLTLNNVRYRAAGTDVQVDNAQLTLKLSLLPRPRLVIRRLHLNGVRTELGSSGEEGASPSSELSDLSSPVTVSIEDLRINNAVVITAPDAEPFTLETLQARLNYADNLNIESLRLNGSGLEAEIRAESGLAPPFEHQLNLSLNNRSAPWVPELQGLTAQIRAQGSLDEMNLDVTTAGPLALSVQGQIRDVLENLAWDLTVDSPDAPVSWPPVSGDAPEQLRADDLSITTSGNLDDYQAQISAGMRVPEAISGDWQVRISGDQQQLIIEQLDGPVLLGRIEGSGDYSLQSDQPEAQLTLQLRDIKPELEQPELAALPGVSGTVQMRLDGQQALLEQLNLRVPDTDWRISGSGRYALTDETLQADINWQQINWPPQAGSNSQYLSREGVLRASGTLSSLEVALTTDIAGQDIPDTQADFQGMVLDNRMQLTSGRLQTLDGDIELTGELSWEPVLEWQLALDASGINPGLQWNEFPGSINARATTTGAGGNSGALSAVLNIQELDGTLRGQPLSGSGEVRYNDGVIRTDGLELRSGDARLELRGDEQALQASIEVPRLHELLPDARGRISGTLSAEASGGQPLSLDNLTLDAALNGTNLAWQGTRAAKLELSSTISADPDALNGETRINIAQLELPQRAPIDTVSIQASSDAGQQSVGIQAQRPDTSLNLQLAGNWDQWPQPQSWRGEISEVSIDNQQTGQWGLRQPAGLQVEPGNLTLQPLCIRQSRAADNSTADIPPGLCVQYTQQPSQRASLELQDLPVALAETFLNIGMRTDLRLSGELSAGWSENLDSLDGELQLSDGQVSFLARNTPPLDVSGGEVKLNLTENQRLRTQWQMRVENDNLLQGDVRYGPVTADEERLSGNIKLDMPDLGWLRKIMPELDRIAGELQLEAELSGPVRQPLVALDVNLKNGAVDYQPLGMRLSDLNLSGESQPGDTLNLQGGFTGGDGRAMLTASLNPTTREATVNLTGENVQLLNSEALKVRISPDMRLTASPDGYQIAGELRIPAALIRPPEGATARVTESEDVVLVGVDQPQEQTAKEAPITGQLKVILGNAVQVDADIAETHLAGELDLVWNNEPVPQANGTIRLVDGRVQAYGQNLDLERSRVIYSDAPADNPRLDIRAVRQIFGDAQVEEAGVAITGTAQEPTVRAYTSPATNEESALAYIATGSNFDHANGQGALNLGLYLLPRLFVSYGVGLFDNGNTANARYEFSEHWNVSVQSGSRDTGVDLNWRQDG